MTGFNYDPPRTAEDEFVLLGDNDVVVNGNDFEHLMSDLDDDQPLPKTFRIRDVDGRWHTFEVYEVERLEASR
jgi:hypothetical protein